jgi:hypothetical protein
MKVDPSAWQSVCQAHVVHVPGRGRAHALPCTAAGATSTGIDKALRAKETIMGKYFLGWLLGVPAIVLVVLWFFFR